MEQYIAKAAIVAEIEKRRSEWQYGSSIEAKYKKEECDDILSSLDTIEVKEVDYENKYKNALERAKKAKNNASLSKGTLRVLDIIFPELKESEDEKIRKGLIENFKWFCGDFPETTKWGKDDDMLVKDIITWLEKQGESIRIKKGKNYLCTKTHKYAGIEWIEGIKYYSPEDYSLVNQGCTCYCPKYSKEEHNNFFKEVEYDGCLEVDKVEPKFKVGDWVVYDHRTYQVVELPKEGCINLGLRRDEKIEFAPSTYCRPWTIQDAKDGDMLAWNDSRCIAIFKNIYDKNSFNSYGFVGHCTGKFESGQSYHNIEGAHPATKEQRDTLFAEMREAGYEWDADKKLIYF